MKTQATLYIQKSYAWLANSVFPLWTRHGIDKSTGGFIESLTDEGHATLSPRRAMVQARQIYSYTQAAKMQIISKSEATQIVMQNVGFLLRNYSLPTGAFLHAVNTDESPESLQCELYTQAFVLFGLAQAYEISSQAHVQQRAKELLNYLNTQRQAPQGGFTEIKNHEILYQSNPHMHLFEAALAWAKIDPDPIWMNLAKDLFALCKNRFIDPELGVICEYFTEDWQVLRERGRFVFEPGHQYEWSWLILQFSKLLQNSMGAIPQKLFDTAEKYGLRRPEGLVVDELWSDFTVKKNSSRFWPQCERIKAALELGLVASGSSQIRYAQAADEAMQALWTYLEAAPKGQWQDTQLELGQFVPQATKASSLYHIINAISDYIEKRPALTDI